MKFSADLFNNFLKLKIFAFSSGKLKSLSMLISIEIDNQSFKIDESNPLHIAIPLKFDGAQPNAYDVERARSKPCEAGELIGDTRRGGSCNFEQITFIPHCNGTHTECVGHLTNERISVHDCLQDVFIPATLISVSPEKAAETNDSYAVKLNSDDLIITKNSIETALKNSGFRIQNSELENESPKSKILNPKSLIVRTLPNEIGKLSRTYLSEIPPFFSTEAIKFINEIGIKHLLVDTPSIDRIFDEGKLSNHRIFWNVAQNSFETNDETRIYNTITELIYAPDEITDGEYLLNLQIAPFAADAAPSRPVLFRLMET